MLARRLTVPFGRFPRSYATQATPVKPLSKNEDPIKTLRRLRLANQTPDAATYQKAIVHCSRTRNPSQLKELYQDIKSKDISPNDPFSCNAFISLFARNNDLERVDQTIAKMKKSGMRLTCATYLPLCQYYSKQKNPDKFNSVFKMMEDQGITPDARCYATRVLMYAALSDPEKALESVQLMVEKKITPTPLVFNALIDLFAKRRQTSEVVNLLTIMESKGFAPSIFAYNSVISMFSKIHQYDEAIYTVKVMESRGVVPNIVTYNIIMDSFSASNRPDLKLAEKMFTAMKLNGPKPDDKTFVALIRLYGRLQMKDQTLKIIEEMRDSGFALTSFAYLPVINMFGKLGEPEECFRLVREMESKQITIIDPVVKALAEIFSHELRLPVKDAKKILVQMHENGVSDGIAQRVMDKFLERTQRTAVSEE